MTNILRTLVALAGLALATGAPAQTAWPDLTNSSSWSFAGNRFSFPSAPGVAGAGATAALGHVYQVSPPYAVSNLRFLFVNFGLAIDASANPERCPGNPITQDFATVFLGGAVGAAVTDKTAYPVTFGGAQSAVIGDCEFIWSDPLRDASGNLVTLPAGTTYYVRSSRSVASGGKLPTNVTYTAITPRYGSNLVLGEGVEYSGTPQTAKRLSGSVAIFSGGSAPIAPAMAIGTGWDGSPVFLVVGDSIGAAQGDQDFTARGVTGHVARGLDDSASGRMNFANFALQGAAPQDQSSIAAGQYRLRMRVLRSIPNKPFNRIFSQMGQNGIYGGNHGVPKFYAAFPQFQSAMRDWWGFLSTSFGTAVPIYQGTFMPHAGQLNGSYWTDTANQSNAGADAYDGLTGIRQSFNAWIRGGSGLPANVTGIDIAGPAADATDPNKWKPLPGSWTLNAAIASNATSAVLAGATAPVNGDNLVFEIGTGNVSLIPASLVSGTGPWTVTFAFAIGKAHAAGTSILAYPTVDGTHPGTSAYKAGAAVIAAKKLNGTVR